MAGRQETGTLKPTWGAWPVCAIGGRKPVSLYTNEPDQGDQELRPGTGKKDKNRKRDKAKNKRKHSRRIRKMVQLGENYCRLSEATKKQLKQVWSGKLEPEQLWWCLTCNRVFRAADIRLYDEPGGDIFTVCPYCSSATFFWWHGWPSLVMEGWTSRPELGKRFYLPCDWLEEEKEEPGIIGNALSSTDAPKPNPESVEVNAATDAKAEIDNL